MDDPASTMFATIASDLALTAAQVGRVTDLLDQGNTVPFITRYRKEQTGDLDEEQIRQIQRRVDTQRQLTERAETIRRLIESQGKLTPALRKAISRADSLKRLEDLYLPFRPKRRSRAMQARQKGLQPLADRIWSQEEGLADLDSACLEFVRPENELPDVAAVRQGAADILAERISDNADIREKARQIAWKSGRFAVSATKTGNESGQEFRDYFDYSEAVSSIPPHRLLALNRGEKSGALRVKFEWDGPTALAAVVDHLALDRHRFSDFMQQCAADSLSRLTLPSLERELRREISDRAERHAVSVFARNLKNLLLQPPLGGQRVLAIDPGFRTGCKTAVLDEAGNCIANDVIYVTGPAEKRAATRQKLATILKEHDCKLIALGNGTACRETEELVSETIAEHAPDSRYTIVNEAGASIYSASNVAREEFPNFDATVRGTISIGRRLQDPLSELVKIDPQHIGVGMYQHDVSERLLKQSLEEIVESCVNYVGVDLNTASASLLRYVSGLNQLVARRIVAWREKNKRFTSRQQLLEVPGLGDATFPQAAGFLKIANAETPFDGTWIHPESYEAAGKLLKRLDTNPESLISSSSTSTEFRDRLPQLDRKRLAVEVGIGQHTCRDILEALSRPGRDPRGDTGGPLFKLGVLKLDDLEEGMELTGTVLNVVDFGVFVDVGLKDSGLVHISQLADRYIASPHEVASVGDVVTVWVISVDRERRRVSLTMIPGAKDSKPKPSESVPAPKAKRVKAKSARVGSSARSKRKPPQTSGSSQSDSPPGEVHPELSSDAVSGKQPLKGFDELKQLWKTRDR